MHALDGGSARLIDNILYFRVVSCNRLVDDFLRYLFTLLFNIYACREGLFGLESPDHRLIHILLLRFSLPRILQLNLE